jgi:hypothetical protein
MRRRTAAQANGCHASFFKQKWNLLKTHAQLKGSLVKAHFLEQMTSEA